VVEPAPKGCLQVFDDDDDLVSRLARLQLRQADRGDFGIGKGHYRHGRIVSRSGFASQNDLNGDPPLVFGNLGQHWLTRHISDGPQSIPSPHQTVDLDHTTFHGGVSVFETKCLGRCLPSRRHQEPIGSYRPTVRQFQLEPTAVLAHRDHLDPRPNPHVIVGE
jgi:hypothetical protein